MRFLQRLSHLALRGIPVVFSVLLTGCGEHDPVASVPTVESPDATDFESVQNPQTFLLRLQAQGAIPAADVNRDGIVDITDLVLVAQNFGQKVEVVPPEVEVVSVDAKLREQGDTYWTYSWKATLRNNTDVAVTVFFDVQFLDKDGFLVERVLTFDTMVPREEKTWTDTRLIKTQLAKDVDHWDARVTNVFK